MCRGFQKWFVRGKLSVCFYTIGKEYIAVVEFAPCQKVPPEKRKLDSRMGTIEQGTFFDFLYFKYLIKRDL